MSTCIAIKVDIDALMGLFNNQLLDRIVFVV